MKQQVNTRKQTDTRRKTAAGHKSVSQLKSGALARKAAVKAQGKPAPVPASRSKQAPGLIGRTAAKDAMPRPVQAAGQLRLEKEAIREQGALAINRALDLLETLARTGPMPLPVLAEAAGFGKTAATDLLTTLQTRHFVIQDEANGVWRLGARWSVMGQAASGQGALAAAAMPFLVALGAAAGENVYLRIRQGMEVATIAVHQTDPALRVYTDVGTKMPLHAGTGRLLLAHAPESVQTQVLTQRLQRFTPSTRIDPKWIAADLHRIRQRGFLITDSEVIPGTVTVCAPVRDASGQVIAALLIGAPSLRMRPPRPRALMPAVVDAAQKLSHALGAVSARPESPVNGQDHVPGGANALTARAMPPGAAPNGTAPNGTARNGASPNGTPSPAPSAAASLSPAPNSAPASAPASALGVGIARPHSIFR